MSTVGRFDSDNVADWVDYIQTLHAREIELSLERVREVYQVICPLGVPFKVISVAGTNGKGSTAEILSSIYRASGVRVAKFTSPHLVRFNERFNIGGKDVGDQELLKAFRLVEQARGEVPITYFEYGLLLAVALFKGAKVDVAVMEVGLGGRLDAVNILDADVAIVTSIALDHTDWLGDTLEKIAYEKAGIARSNTPCLVGLREPQTSMMEHFNNIGAVPHIIGQDFDFSKAEIDTWAYRSNDCSHSDLPLPLGQAGVQLINASLAIRAVEMLNHALPVTHAMLQEGLTSANLAGRCQVLSVSPLTVLDVSHNEASVQRLADFLSSRSIKGQMVAVCGMLKDKEVVASLSCLAELIDQWHFATINAERGATASYLADCLVAASTASGPRFDDNLESNSVSLYADIESAYNAAIETLTENDCLVVFGSFYVVGDIIKELLQQDKTSL